jgi:hypothetical protein
MAYKIKCWLPSKNEYVLVKEISFGLYRDLIKSLHGASNEDVLLQTNLVLKELVQDIDELTVEDKLSILLAAREICISPDITLKGTCPDTDKPFNWSIEVRELLTRISKLNLNTKFNDLNANVKGSFTGIKLRDELHYSKEPESLYAELVARIDTLQVESTKLDLKGTYLEKKELIEQLPASVLSTLTKALQHHLEALTTVTLLDIKSPHTGNTILYYNGRLNQDTISQIIKYLFIEDLTNVYRSFYNMVKYCQFAPAYLDIITPAEIQVYWSYYMQDSQNEERANEQPPSASLNINNSQTPNSEFGF